MTPRRYWILFFLFMGVLISSSWQLGYRAIERNWGWIRLTSAWMSPSSSRSFDGPEVEIRDEKTRRRLSALHAYLAGDCLTASRLFEQVLLDAPTDIVMLVFAGNAHYQCGDTKAAVDKWKSAGAAPYLLTRCEEAWEQLLLEESINWCRLAIEADPKFAKAHYSLGRAYARRKEYLLALEHYQQAASLDKGLNLQRVYFQIGLIYRAVGNFEAAETYFLREMEANPAYSGAPYMLGLLYLEQKRYVEAEEYLSRAIQLEPERLEAAEAYLLRAIELNPSDPSASHILERLHLDRQRNGR